MSMNMDDFLNENKYIEVQEFLVQRRDKLVDSEILPLESSLGLDLRGAAFRYTASYGGSNSFMLDMRVNFAKHGTLSLAQIRACLNCLKNDLERGIIKLAGHSKVEVEKLTVIEKPNPIDVDAIPAPEGSPVKTHEHNYKCYSCGRYFITFEDVMRHKTQAHGYVGKATTKSDEMTPVLATPHPTRGGAPTEKSALDLSTLPDGRYACIDPTGRAQYKFLMVKTIKKRVYRNRRFRYGRIITGSEWIEAGTREVREWSTDSKRLCGQQKPGEGYEGEYTDQLVEIMQAPKIWALVFAKFIGCCFRCAKTLTDDESRERGYGPECKKYIESSGYWKNKLASMIAAKPV